MKKKDKTPRAWVYDNEEYFSFSSMKKALDYCDRHPGDFNDEAGEWWELPATIINKPVDENILKLVKFLE